MTKKQIIRENEMRDKLLSVMMMIGILVTVVALDGDAWSYALVLSASVSIFGYINLYFTSKRSVWFIIPDGIWIALSVLMLFKSQMFTDIPQYLNYFILMFVQWFNWYNNRDEFGEAKPRALDKTFIIICVVGLVVALIDFTFLGMSSRLPIAGALMFYLSFVAGWALAFRFAHAETMFFILDVLQIVYFMKAGLYLTAFMFVIFSVMALVYLTFNRLYITYDIIEEE